MNYDQLVYRLNNTPIKINTKLMRIRLKEYEDTITSAKEYIHDEMTSMGIKVNNDYISDQLVVDYCNQFLVKKFTQNKPYHFDDNEKFNLTAFKEHFPNDSFVNAYIAFRECLSLKKRYEAILKHEKNGYIQPTFAINSAGSIYTAKPALQLSRSELALYFDCNHYYFNSLQEAIEAVANAKEDSEIITLVRTTVFYRNDLYKQDKEKRRQEVIAMIEAEDDFMPLEPYYGEFTLDDLGFSYEYSTIHDGLQKKAQLNEKNTL